MANIYAVATGDWSNVNTWSDSSGGAPPAAAVPGPGDAAILDANSGVINVTVDGVTSVSQVNGTAYAGTLTVANALTATAGLVAMAGNLVLNADFTISDTPSAITATVTGAGDLTCNGVFTIDAGADFSGHTGTVVCAGVPSYTFTPGCALGTVEFKKTAGTASLGAALTCSSFTITSGGFTNGGAGNPVDVAGNITFTAGSGTIDGAWTCGGSFSVGAGFNLWQIPGSLTFDAAAGNPTITTNEVRLPAITVDNAGVTTFALQDDLECDGFTLTDGKFDANGNDVTAHGHLIITAGTLAGTGSKWTQAASGNVVNATSGNKFTHLELASTAGVTSTLTGDIYAIEATLGPGTTTGAHTLYFYPTGNDQWHQHADATFSISRLMMALYIGNCEVGAIDVSGCSSGGGVYGGGDNRTITAIGNWNSAPNKDITIWNTADAKYGKLAMGAYKLTARDVILGANAINKGGGQISFDSGRHTFRNLNIQAGGNAAEDLVNFGTALITLTGTIDGTGIDTQQNTSAAVIGGTTDDLDLTGQTPLLHFYRAAAGTNIVLVTELDPLIGDLLGMALSLDMAA